MDHLKYLLLDEDDRADLWQHLAQVIEQYLTQIGDAHVASSPTLADVQAFLESFNFVKPLDPHTVVNRIAEGLQQFQVHTPHPRYFGLFNPAPTTMGIVADALVAAFNPQLASWSHSPLPNEIERHLVQAFGSRFGYAPSECDGTFASGGAEANHTAVLTALTKCFPEYNHGGVRALAAQPVIYVSSEGHHSIVKAARLCGLGTDACRVVPVNDRWQLAVEALRRQIQRDRAAGLAPFLIVATAGTTSAGVIDPLAAVADIAAAEKCWFHADAAWGGAAALVPELRPLLAGIERADSITFDAHKWLSLPMGAGLFLTRHPEILSRTFGTRADYMPRVTEQQGVDPYAHTMQWSRRFIGLKVFLSLAVAGWEGYAAAIRHMTAMGDHLRDELDDAGWEVINQTPLPTVCFVDRTRPDGRTASYLDGIANWVVTSGRAWISTTRVGPNIPVLRACITNYRTGVEDIRALVRAVNAARDAYSA